MAFTAKVSQEIIAQRLRGSAGRDRGARCGKLLQFGDAFGHTAFEKGRWLDPRQGKSVRASQFLSPGVLATQLEKMNCPVIGAPFLVIGVAANL